MARHALPRRFQIVNESITAYVIEFPDGACVSRTTGTEPTVKTWESLDAVKSYWLDKDATLERID